jgi:predicted ATPase
MGDANTVAATMIETSMGRVGASAYGTAARGLHREVEAREDDYVRLAAGQHVGPYEIAAVLGAGGMGEVYRARDTRLNREVALKLVNQTGPTADAVDRFHREAQATSALNHPNIVTVHEIGEAAEGRFIVMELVAGRTLRQLVGELSIPGVLRVGVQVAQALAAAHTAGISHRDLKPENIMLRPDGYVKVLDFGLARLVRDPISAAAAETTAQTATHTLLGTLRYMSPEQARGERVGSAADVFALGLILYELATGQHPFAAESSLATLHAIASAHPCSPAGVNPGISEPLDRLIMQMLGRDPLLRPAAAEVAAALADLEHARNSPHATARNVRTSRSVGRSRERLEIRAAYDAASAGRGLVICVSGEPGIGKTTFVEEFLEDLASENAECWIARGRCSERLAGTEAYLPVLEALDNLRHGRDADAFTRLAKALAPTWYEYLLPDNGGSESGERRREVKAASPERFKREFATLLTEMSRRRPIVLALDDVHWADASTVDLLSYLATRFDSIRIVTVATYRPADLLLARHPFAALRLELEGRGLCRDVALPFLDRNDVDAYLALEFPPHGFPPDFASLIYRKTEGNPLFMVDVLRDLRTRGVIARQHDRWALVEAIPAIEREMPASVRSLIQRTIERLDDDDRGLLAAASVQGYEFDAAVLARSLGRDAVAVEERLDRLEQAHRMIATVGEHELPDGTLTLAYRFVHVLYQNALYGSLRPARRASLSGAVADALVSFHQEKAPEIATELALLFETARDLPRATEYLLIATQNAVKLFADEEAIALARRGLDLLQKLPTTTAHDRCRLQLQLLLGTALSARRGFADSEVQHAYAQARELGHTVGDSADVFPALHGLYRYFLARGDFSAACEMVERMVELAQRLKDPTLLLIAEGAYGSPLVQLGDFAGALNHLETSLSFYDPKDYGAHRQLEIYGADPRMTMLAWVAKAHWQLGYDDRAVEHANASLTLARAREHPFTLAYALVLTAWLHTYRRDVEAVIRYADEGVALSLDQGFFLWSVGGTMFQQWALAQQGHADEALQVMQATLATYRAGGGVINLPHFIAMTAETSSLAGDDAEALRLVKDALGIVATTGERCWESELHRLQADLLLKQGRDIDGEESLQRAVAVAHDLGARVLELRALCSLARLYRRQQKADLGRAKLEQTYASFTEGFDSPDLRDAQTLLAQLAEPAGS